MNQSLTFIIIKKINRKLHTNRIIRDLGVFAVTATSSVLAYLWLVVILMVLSPDVVTPIEGGLSLAFFPMLVCIGKYFFSRCHLHSDLISIQIHFLVAGRRPIVD